MNLMHEMIMAEIAEAKKNRPDVQTVKLNMGYYTIPAVKNIDPVLTQQIATDITVICANEYGADIDKVFSKSRKRQHCEPRQIAMWIIKKNIFQDAPLWEVGAYFGNLDHASVIHSCKVVENQMETDKAYLNRVQHLLIASQVYVQNIGR